MRCAHRLAARARTPAGIRSALRGLPAVVAALAAAALALNPDAPRWGAASPVPGPLLLRVAISAEPTVLDPHDASDGPSSLINFHLYDRLVELDEAMEPRPALAVAWERSADGLTWTLHLRQGVRFHDGTPLDAAAVVANLNRIADPERAPARRGLLGEAIASAHAAGPHTVVVTLRRPVGSFLRLLAHEAHGIVSPRAIEAARAGAPFRPIGTGPFFLDEWVPGTRLVLRANREYWRGAPQLDGLVFVTVPEGSSRAIMVETGAVDLAYPVDPLHVARLAGVSGVEVWAAPSQRMIYLALNVTRPPFDDVRVRRAAAMAVDREAIVRHLLLGLGRPADAPVAPQTWGYAPAPLPGFDPEGARRLLDEVYGDGERPAIELWSPSNRYPQDKLVAEALAAFLTDVGFTVRVTLFEWGTYLARLGRSGEWDAAVLGWVPSTGDADMALRPLFHSGERANHAGFQSAAVDALIEAGARTPDSPERLETYRRLQALLAEEAPVVWLYSVHLALARRSRVSGVRAFSTEILDLRGADRLPEGS